MTVIPCWEINTYSLAFKAKNKPMMMEVLNDMGLNPRETARGISTTIGTFDLKTGEVEVSARDKSKVNSFRKKYSERVIGEAAKKFKWNIKKQKVGSKTVFNAIKW